MIVDVPIETPSKPKQSATVEMHWRPMLAQDLNGVVRVARLGFPDHYESRDCFAERLALYAKGCFVLYHADLGVAGYLIAYPWRAGSAPPLNSLIGELPAGADLLYLHDLALDPQVRGVGQTKAIIERLAAEARKDGWHSIALVAVNQAEEFWRKMGFVRAGGDAMKAKLATYGEDAAYMLRTTNAQAPRRSG